MISLYNDKYDCCGCMACMSICPTNAIIMQSNEDGFLYPDINDNLCIDCKACKKVCVFQNRYNTIKNFEIPKVYAVKHKSD